MTTPNNRQPTAEITNDPGRVSGDGIPRAASDAGQGLGERYVHQTLPIQGMHCADCVRTLEHGVDQLEGVERVSVNFTTARMTVDYDIQQIDLDEINRRVSYLGYRVGDDCQSETISNTEHGAVRSFLFDEEIRITLISAALVLTGIVLTLTTAPAIVATALYTVAILAAGLPIARKGVAGLRINHQLDINILMTIAVVGAAVIGEWLEAATVVILFSLGEALEDFSMDRARNSIRSLMSLTPNDAIVRRDGSELTVPVAEIVPGDIVVIRPGERIPIDSVITSGHSTINQAPVTGESIPVETVLDMPIFAGTINGAGVLEIRATRPASDSMIARIINMVEEAQAHRAPSQRFIDGFAKYYTPAVVVGAAFVAVFPPLILGESWSNWLYRALILLVIACPCALVISTPVSIVSALSTAARNGVLIKGGAYLEALARLRAIAFDKTGTLTRGEPTVTAIISLNGFPQEEILRYAAAAERYSEHPLGDAIIRAAQERDLGFETFDAEGTQTFTSKGIEATIDGKTIRVGTRKFILNGQNTTIIETQLTHLERAGNTTVLVSIDSQPVGIIGLADELRPEAPAAIQTLRAIGIDQVIMLSGDRQDVAQTIANQVGIDSVKAQLLPEEKVDAVAELLDQYGAVAMVGDGVNDAPALARSTVGIAMGAAGTDTALETADVALMGDDLQRVEFAIRLSHRTRRIIIENITLALGIKAVIFVLAIAGYATLWQAIFADVGASLIVILNGMRLLRQTNQSTSHSGLTDAVSR